MKKFLTIALIATLMSALYGENCRKITFDEVYREYGTYFAYATDNAAGDPEVPDKLQIDFRDGNGEEAKKLEVGTYTLTPDFLTCETCIAFYEDFDEISYSSEKVYIQESGTFNITKVKEGTKESQGNASFRLVEADWYNYQPVVGGKCYDVENLTWDTICIPDCTGKVCGSDGCSSVCGLCGKNQGCSKDQSKCEDLDLSDCTGISIDLGTLKKYFWNSFKTSSEGGIPYIYMTFFLDEDKGKIKTGTYDLGNDEHLNFETAAETVKLYSGYDKELKYYTKMYFQHGGILTVDSVTENNQIKGTLSVKLVEADIAEDDSTTFFAGSKCLEIETSAFDTLSSHDSPSPDPEGCAGNGECVSDSDCDPGYYCGNDCWCYFDATDDPDTDHSDSGSTDTSDNGSDGSGSNDGSNDNSGSNGGENNGGGNDNSDSDSSVSGSNDNTSDSASSNPDSSEKEKESEESGKKSDGCSVLTI